MIWVARPELGPKLNVTLDPGWAASNCLPSWVNVPCSEAAANTVMEPEVLVPTDRVPVDAAVGLELVLELHPATATTASPAAATTKRRM
jgi:hypothetical protein